MTLTPRTRDDVRADLESLPAELRAQISADWWLQLERAPMQDPWVHGFHVRDASGDIVGQCGFKGPPANGIVEIAYAIQPDHQGRGHATAAARALVAFAFDSGQVCLVRAHTLPEGVASQRVLIKAGFRKAGEAVDPEDGLVWRFELSGKPA